MRNSIQAQIHRLRSALQAFANSLDIANAASTVRVSRWARFSLLLLGSAGNMAAAGVIPLPTTAVGQQSAAIPVTLTIRAAGVAVDPIAVTQGVSGLDFTLAPASSCLANSSYSPGQQCTVNVMFAPKYPGLRQGAVVLKAADGTLLATALLQGTGTGSLSVLVPGIINTVAGDGELNYRNDDGPAISSPIFLPYGVTADPKGNLYISDTNNSRIRRVDAQTGMITTIAGIGTPGYSGDGGRATAASISQPSGLCMDGAGNLYFADSGNSLVRRIDAISGIITTVAGTPLGQGYSGDGGAATAATLASPRGVAFDAAGDLFIADTSNNVVREVNADSGNIQTVVGNGVRGYNGDSIPATSAALNSPWTVAIGADNSIYIADLANNRVRKVTAGTITTVAGTGGRGFNGDGGPAAAAVLNDPTSVVLDPAGNLYIADSENNRIRKINAATSVIQTIVGADSEQFTGDGGPASLATIYAPYALFIDQSGSLYLSDTLHNRIRGINATPAALNYPVMRVSKTSSPLPQGLENDGNDVLNLVTPVLKQAALDAATTTCSTTQPLPTSSSCNLGIEFAPTVVGNNVQGSVTLGSNAGNSPAVVNLSGQVLDVEPTTVALTSSANPSLAGQSIVLTAVVSSADTSRSGPVSFLDGTTAVCSNVNLSAGTATCTTSTLSLGQHSITASYAGDTNNAASVSAALTQVIKQQPTLVLAVSPSPSIATQNVTLSVTATASTGTPTGPVVFYDGATAISGSVSLNGSGVATFATTQLTPGQHSLAVQYAGDATNASGQSNTVPQTVNQATSTTTVAANNTTVFVGTSVTFTAAVTDANSTVPTGSVQFSDGGTPLGGGTLDNSGRATLTIANLTPGTHNIIATYGGDLNDQGSSSAPIVETIQQIPTLTLLSSDADPASAGAMIHFIASVVMSPGTTAAGAITGTVTFRDGSTGIGTAPIDSAGSAGISVSTLTPGQHNIVATFPGSDNYALSSSSTLTETVTSTATTTTLSTSGASALSGKPLTLTATVVSPTGSPTGAVAFQDGTTLIGRGTLNAQGLATLATTSLTAGNHAITAVYQGDGSYITSTSTPVAETISLATPTLSLTSATTSTTVGTAVEFSTTLSSNGVTPTGNVTLRDGTASLALQSVTATGTNSFDIFTLSVGVHTLTASYGGDSNNSPQTSAPLSITIQQAATTTSLLSSASPSIVGQTITLTAGVSSTAGNSTGSLSFMDGSTVLGSVPVGSNGSGVLTTTSLSFGAHSLTAVYSGDTNHTASHSAAINEQIVEASNPSVVSSLNPSVAGLGVVFNARVAGVGTLVPTGSVIFNDGAATLGTVQLDTAGAATFQSSTLAVGSHSITISYSGDRNYATATSAPLIQTVQSANTQIELTAGVNPATYGIPLAIAATVRSNGGIATGSVTVTDDGFVLGSAVLNGSGAAVLTTASLSPGAHSIVATYAGDGKASASVSSPITLSVRQVTTLKLASDSNPALTLSSIVLTAALTNNGATPFAGTVTFTDGTTQLGTSAVDATGHAALKIPLLSVGTHQLAASYAGDANNFGSSSAPLSEVVQLRSTTTALTSASANPNNPQEVTLIGIVRWTGPGVPTGIITFSSGGTVLGTSPTDASGAATINITLAPNATQTATASYSGDQSYGNSASSNVTVTGGQPAQFGVSLNPSSVSIQSKQHTVIQLTLSSIKGFSDTVQLGCVGLPFAATCTFSNVQVKLAGNGTTTVQLTLDTGDPLGAGALVSQQERGASNVLACFLPAAMVAGFGLFSRRRRSLQGLLLLAGAFAVTAAATGCSGLQMTGTPVGTYTFKITGSGINSGATETQAFNLTVTQ